MATLHRGFLATPYRPTGLSTPARTIVGLVDDLNWLNAIVQSKSIPGHGRLGRATCAVKADVAAVLEQGADLLEAPGATWTTCGRPSAGYGDRWTRWSAARPRSFRPADSGGRRPTATGAGCRKFLTSLDPSFRAQELSFAVSQIARNIELTTPPSGGAGGTACSGASRGCRGRSRPRGSGRQPTSSGTRCGSTTACAAPSGLGLAVLVAKLTGVQHSFWVIFGTLSVLRSNALNTGQFIVRGVARHRHRLRDRRGAARRSSARTRRSSGSCCPSPSCSPASHRPSISFAAGQAAFTVTLLILFNVVQPAGWSIGLVRIEDVALGCAVSLVVGLLFWPRGAAAALRRALADAYVDSARYLDRASSSA